MRPYSARALQSILLAVVLLLALFHAPAPPPARAGEAIRVGGPAFGVEGQYFTWNTTNISYTVDGGTLGLQNNAAAVALVDSMFGTWQAVPTSTLSFTNTGAITSACADQTLPNGDVNTAAEVMCLGTTGNPIIFDTDGTIVDGLLGVGASASVLGFAGPSSSSLGFHTSGSAVLNGEFIDGVGPIPGNNETTIENMQATALHEFGHFIGLGHTQINDHCFTMMTCADFSDATFAIPTMYPISFGLLEAPSTPPELTLALDDIAFISKLFPDPTFNTTHGTISGTLFASDGLSMIQGGNVIARQVDDPATVGLDESLRCAVSIVSGELYTGNRGQAITGDNPGDFFGSRVTSLFGTYSMPVPTVLAGLGPAACAAAATDGMYTVEVESINSTFTAGSGIGPTGNTLSENIPIPGPAEFFSSPETNSDATPGVGATVNVSAGMTTSNIDIILNGTPNTNDAFEGGTRNDTPATASPIGNGTTSANISPLLVSGPDMDVYAFTALPNTTVTLEIFARRAPYNDFLDPVLEIVDAGGVRVPTGCDSNFLVSAGPPPVIDPYDGVFDDPCLNDDITLGVVRDSRLFLRSASGGTFFVRVFDWTGGARVDFLYDLVVTGAGQAPPPPGFTKDFDGGPTGTGTDWATAANWNPDGLPIATDDVFIGAAFNVTKSSAGGDLVNDLTVNGSLTNQAGSGLTISGTLVVASPLTISGGAISVNGPANVNQLNLTGGTLNVSSTPGPLNVVTFTMTGGSLNVNTVFNAMMPYTQNGGATHLSTVSSTLVAPMVTLASGTIDGIGSVNADVNQTGGNINPGSSPGILAINGNLTQGLAGVINVELGGTTPGNLATNHDQFNISGTATVDGTFRILQFGGFAPNIGDSFTIAQCLSGVNCGSGNTQLDFSAFPLPADRMFVDVSPGTNNMLVIQVQAVTACEINFDNSNANGLWQDPLNWDTNVLPGSSGATNDDVCIGPGFTVTKSAAGGDSINSLTVDDAAGVFTLSNNLAIAAASTIGTGGMTQNAGTLSGAGALTITGPFNWSGGTQSGTGSTTVSSPLNITGTVNLDTRTLNNNGTANMTGGATTALQVLNGAIFNNTATGTFNANSDFGVLDLGGGGTFNNAGVFIRGVSTQTFTFQNIAFNNTGTVNVLTGGLELGSNGTSSGAFTVAMGSVLAISGVTQTLTSDISGAGTVNLASSTLNLNGGSYNVTGTTRFGGNGTTNINPGVNLISVGVVQVDGQTANFSSGETVNATSLSILGGGTLTGSDAVTVSGVFTWTEGTVSGGPGIVTANGGINIGSVFVLLDTRRLDNNGVAATASFSTQFSFANGAIFNNTAAGTFNAVGSAGIVDAGGGGTFNNAGIFTRSTSATIFPVGITFNNTGSVDVQTGTLDFTGGGTCGGTCTGTWTTAATTTLGLGGNFDLSGAVSGAGEVEILSGTTDFRGPYNITGTTNVNNGTANFNAASTVTSVGALTIANATANFSSGNTITPSAATQTGGVLTGTDTLTLSTLFTWSGGSQDGAGTTNANGGMNITGGVTLNTGRILNNTGAGTMSGAGILFLNSGAAFNNSGTFDIQNIGQIVGGGQNFNNSGTLTKSGGGGTSIITCIFSNTGTVNANNGDLNFSGSFTQTAGLTRLNGGTLGGGITFNFNGGVLEAVGGSTISGNVNNVAASVRPGMSPGTLNIVGNYIQGAGGSLNIELGGAGAGQFDVMAITGSATLAGTLNVQPFGGFIPGANMFTVMTFGSRVGDFGTVNNTTGNASLTTVPGATNYVLNFAAAPGACPGGAVQYDGGPAGTGTDFDTAANWAGDVLPGAGNDACIDIALAVTYDGSVAVTVNSLTVTNNAGLFTQSGGTLTLNSTSFIGNSGFTQTGGSLAGAGALTITGPFNWSGGTQTGTGATSAMGGVNITGPVNFNSSRILNTAGTSTWSAGLIQSGQNAAWNHSGTLNVTGNDTINNAFGGVASFTNTGTVNKNSAGITNWNIAFNNNSITNATSGMLNLGGGGASSGMFNVAATLGFSGGTHTVNGAVTGAGTVEFSGGTTDINSTYNVTGGTTFNGGTGNFNAASTTSSVGALSISSGTANFSSGETITATNAVTQSGGTLTGTDLVQLNAPFTWTGGTQSGTGTTNAAAGVSIGGQVNFNGGRILNTAGASTWSSGLIQSGQGASWNNSGTLNVTGNDSINNAFGGAASFTNTGTVTKMTGVGVTNWAIAFNNNATTDANSGTLNLSAGGTSAGAFNVAATLQFSNSYTLTAASSVMGAGTVLLSSGTVDINGTYTITGDTNLTVATANFNTAASTTTLTQSGGALAGTGAVTVSNLSTWSGGLQSGTGTTTWNNGVNITAQVNFNSSRILNTMGTSTWSAGLIQSGQTAVWNQSGTLNVTGNDTINNAFGGAATFTNTGTVNKNSAGITNWNIAFNNGTVATPGNLNVNGGTFSQQFAVGYTQMNAGSLTRLMGGSISTSSTLLINGGVLDGIAGSMITGNGTVNNAGGIVAPGMSPGDLIITGNYMQGAGGVYAAEVSGTTPITQHDQINLTGIATLGGMVNVTFPAFTPVGGELITIMNFGSRVGTFAGVACPPLPGGLVCGLQHNLTSVVLQISADADLALTKSDSADPVVVGQPLTYTIMVSNNGPATANNIVVTDVLPAGVTLVSTTGCVEDPAGAPTCTLGSIVGGGNASFTITVTPTAAGLLSNPASVTANEADPVPGNNADTETTTVNQAATTTAVASSLNPSMLGDMVTFTATVTATAPGAGVPTGNVNFFDGAAMIGSGVLNGAGQATLSTSALTVGAHPITATYVGDANFTGSTSPVLTQTVNMGATTTAVVSSANPSVFGQPVTFTATVTPVPPATVTPTGTVDFFDGVTLLGSGALNAAGQATFSTSALSVASHSITAVYNGDANYSGSTSPALMQVVNQAATTTAVVSSVNPTVFGQSTTFTATVAAVAPGAGTPTGTVDFFDGAANIGSVALGAGGTAALTTSTLSVGAHAISAVYNGDANFTGSTGNLPTQTVNQAATSTAVVSSLNPSNSGQAVTFTATVSVTAPGAGTPTGTVDFFDGVTNIGTVALAGGTAALTTSALTPGVHSITATYNGDVNFLASTSPAITQTVNNVADVSVVKTDVADPVNVGQNIVYTVTVANAGPDPATAVVLTDTLPIAVTFVSAVPSQGGPCTQVGVTVTCPLGTINSGGNATVAVTVLTVALSAPSVTNSATASTTSVDPNAANNTGTQMTTVNPVADLAITKTDSPDPAFIGSSLTYTIVVTNNGPSPATAIMVSDTLPVTVNFSSIVAPAGAVCTTPGVGATGTVNCTLAGMLNSGASATITIVTTTTAASVPSVSNTAMVTSAIPDPNAANNSSATTTTVTAVAPATDFSIMAQPINNNVTPGQSGTYTVTVSPLPAGSNFATPIALTCMSPTGTCTVLPNMVTPGTNPATATMTVDTNALLGSAPSVPGPSAPPEAPPVVVLWTFLAGLLLVSLGFVGRKTHNRRLAPCMAYGLVLLVVSLGLGQSACATRTRRQVTGPYTVTVTGTSGALSHSTTVTLNVTRR